MRTPGTVTSDAIDTVPDGPDDRSIETFATPLTSRAGEEVVASCVVRRGEEHLPGVGAEIFVTPNPGVVNRVSDGWRFNPTIAGTYEIHCHTAEGGLWDSQGIHVEVTATDPATVDTRPAVTTAQAGVPVVVTCNVYDRFANLVAGARADGVVVDATFQVDPTTGADFVVRGTEIGTFPIACQLGDDVDPTPADLSVVAGIPGATETHVDRTDIGPTEVVTVSCSVTDDFGNPLTGVPTEVAVMAADGSSVSEAGIEVTGNTFTVMKAGTYYVFCRVPGYLAGDESPALVSVRWGLPCTWACDILEEECYWQGRRLPLSCPVFDRWGNEVEDAQLDLTAVPNTGVVRDGPSSWIFNSEGDFQLTVSITPPLDSQSCAGLSGYAGNDEVFDIRVDSTGPQFDISSPARAAMVSQGSSTSDTSVSITGNVTDAFSPIVSASINGISLGANGTQLNEPISLSQSSRWGLNTITGLAEDECGNQSVLVQSYLRSADTTSSRYLTAATSPNTGAHADRGVVAQLNQTVIDDGYRGDLDDLASVAEALLQAQDYDALAPPGYDFAAESFPSCGGCDFWGPDIAYLVERDPGSPTPPPIQLDGPYVDDLQAVDGGLQITAHVSNFDFPLRVWAEEAQCICGWESSLFTIDITGTAGAARLDLDGIMAASLVAGSPEVSTPTLNVTITDADPDLNCDSWIDWLCEWIADTLSDLLNDMLEDAVEDAIAEEVPPLVEDTLSGFVLDSGFDIPPPVDMRLEVSSGLDLIVFCGANVGLAEPADCYGTGYTTPYGRLGLYTQIYPLARDSDIPVSALGPIRKSGDIPYFSGTAYQFGMGLKDDLLNQILWALWYGGGLDIDRATMDDLIASAGFSGIRMSLFANLPPVLMPGRDGWEVQLGLGDVYVEATADLAELLGGTSGVDSLDLGLYLSTTMGGSLEIISATNELQIQLDTNPEILVEVVSIDDPGYQAVMSDIFTQILQIVLPTLLSEVIASFPIPEIDLTGMANLPPGTDLKWTLTGGSVDRSGDYYRLTGGID